MDRTRIVAEIKRMARQNGGQAPGRQKFEKDSGIKFHDWYPHFWLRWGDALQEAGFFPNKMQGAFKDEFVFESYIALVRRLRHVPVAGELRRESKSNPSFPSESVFNRFGGKKQLLARIAEHCRAH